MRVLALWLLGALFWARATHALDQVELADWLDAPEQLYVQDYVDGNGNLIPVSVPEYVAGVLWGEIRGKSGELGVGQAFIAQAIAARTNLRRQLAQCAACAVPNGTGFQFFLPSDSYPDVINDAVDAEAGHGMKVISYPGRASDIYAEFFDHQWPDLFTRNPEDDLPTDPTDNSYHGYYLPYLRESTANESGPFLGPAGHGVGMSQEGAVFMSQEGRGYETILGSAGLKRGHSGALKGDRSPFRAANWGSGSDTHAVPAASGNHGLPAWGPFGIA